MRLAMFAVLLTLLVPTAYAERCWMTGGCVGQIGYMYIPRSQREAASIFVESGLPKIKTIAVLKVNGFVFPSDSISDPRFPGDLVKAAKENRQVEWGMELASGAKIRVLGYQTFANLKEHDDQMFLHVLIITDQ